MAEKPVFSFAFDKYLARNRIHDLGAVSILMGANDLQCTPAADLSGALTQYIQGMKTVVDSIRQSDERTAVILNIPVPGSAQYAWGEQLGCYATAKQYRRNMAAAADAILREFDGREDENIYLCPMHAALDTESGFATAAVHPDCYSQTFRTHGANWVHPSPAGYYQMGDALCAVVEAVRQKREISG